MQLRQLQAQHRTALLSLAGIETRCVVREPHLDILALGSGICLSAPDLFVARVAHGGLELLDDELEGRLPDAGAGGTVAEFEPLPVITELAVERRGDRLPLEPAALPLDPDRRPR